MNLTQNGAADYINIVGGVIIYVTGPMKINHVSANYIELYLC